MSVFKMLLARLDLTRFPPALHLVENDVPNPYPLKPNTFLLYIKLNFGGGACAGVS